MGPATVGHGENMSPAQVGVILDLDGKSQRLFVDGNINGDFTDEPPAAWTMRTYTDPESGPAARWNGSATVVIPFASGARRGELVFYGPECSVETGQPARPVLFYYANYGLVGPVKIGGQTISAALDDAGGAGHFKLSSDVMASPTLWLDLPSGTQAKGRTLRAGRPFEVDGKWWALTNLNPDGTFQIVASAKPPEPRKVQGPDLSPGKQAPAIEQALAGKKK